MRDSSSIQIDESEPATALSSPPAQLADATTTLLGCRGVDEVYQVIGEFLTDVSPGSMVIVNEITPDMNYFITRGLYGLDDSVLAKAARLVGFKIVDKHSIIVPKHRDQMLGTKLSKVEGGFAELAASEVSPTVTLSLETSTSVRGGRTLRCRHR